MAPSPPFWVMHHGGAVSCNIVEPEGLSESFFAFAPPDHRISAHSLKRGLSLKFDKYLVFKRKAHVFVLLWQ